VPIVKKAQHSRKSQILLFFKVVISSCKLKFASAARGELLGRRAWMNAFSLSESHEAVDGTRLILVGVDNSTSSTYNRVEKST
jgi:hypothetical protein